MYLNISKDVLVLSLSRAQGIVEKKATMPILSNVLLESTGSDSIRVTATNLNVFVQGEYDALVEEGGTICVNAKDLFNIAKDLPPGNMTLKTDDAGAMVHISAPSLNFKLPLAEHDQYPSIPAFEELSYFDVDAKSLAHMIDHTKFSVANDDPRIFLNGVNCERISDKRLRLVSTDGHRLSLIEGDAVGESGELKMDRPAIIPKKGVEEIRRLLDENPQTVALAFSDNNAFFQTDNVLLVMRLIEGDFPDYNMVIPQNQDKRILVNREQLIAALKRISYFSVERNNGVLMQFSKGQLNIQSSSPDRGEGVQTLDVDYNEEQDVSIGFNARFFMDVLNVLKEEQVVLELSDELSPCVVRPTNEDSTFLCVIMPMRI